MGEFDEIVHEFLVESNENLDQLDQDLLALEHEPDSRTRLASVFRTIHTIKGTSGFLAFTHLEALTHTGENLLGRLRDGHLSLTPQITTTLLEMVDAIRAVLSEIERTGGEGAPDHTRLIATLARLLDPSDTEPLAPPSPPPAGEVAAAGNATGQDNAGDSPRHSIADASIRVDVELLDDLMTLVGELVLTRNQIVQHASVLHDPNLLRASARLNLIVGELQERVMKTRMQPIDNVWSKMPRVVRDLAVACHKQVRVQMEGRETELDRTILEATKDPLTHIVRNAVDHGMETPEERIALGKPAEGTILLRAFHEGGQVNIEITDDGRGIDPVQVGHTAVGRGLLTQAQLDQMTEREIVHLVFLPGFSTAEKITNISGRGVGMDVVKTNIERIGGTVDVASRGGTGTTFRIKIPLTLAIIPALTVTCAGDCYAIPQVNLIELVRLAGDTVSERIEEINGAPVYRLRGTLLPLVYLDAELGVQTAALPRRETLHIAVLQAEDRPFGLVVDTVLDTEDIVVKPLGRQLKGIPAYAGATILGDGSVALILDVLALAQRANVLAKTSEHALTERASSKTTEVQDVEPLLIVGMGDRRRAAIPLSMVTRLEEFSSEQIERVGRREVVQYRGKILPLARLGSAGGCSADGPQNFPVVVSSEGGRSVGLVVGSILDIASAPGEYSDLDDDGLVGSAVVASRITELLDVRAAILAADPRFYDESSGQRHQPDQISNLDSLLLSAGATR